VEKAEKAGENELLSGKDDVTRSVQPGNCLSNPVGWLWIQNMAVEPQEQQFHPLMDLEWETFISKWAMKIAHHLRVPLKGSLHSFATAKKELVESLDPRSEDFWVNLSKIIFMVEYLPKHHGSLSTGQAEFHDMFAQHVAGKGHITNITRWDAMVSAHMGKKRVNILQCQSLW
jgi:hypothetical protein